MQRKVNKQSGRILLVLQRITLTGGQLEICLSFARLIGITKYFNRT